jgi:microcystin-dependent protein
MSQILDIYAGLTGTILPTVATSAPSGWLLCDGTAVSRTDYANLFNLVGTAFGAGNGSTTFNLPDLRGRSIIGVGQGASLSNRTRGQTGGTESHQLSTTELPSHQHFSFNNSSSSVGSPAMTASQYPNRYNSTGTNGSYDIQGSTTAATIGLTSVTGDNTSHNNMSPFMALSYIIRA